MKLARPKLSPSLTGGTVEVMIGDGELGSAYVHDEAAVNCHIAALHLTDVLIENVQLTGAHLSRIVGRDVIFRRCDLSSVSLDNGMLVRIEFVNCRMTGVDFSYTNIHDVTFRDCKLNSTIFNKADLRRVHFVDCSLDDVDFLAANCVDVEH